MTNLLTSIKNIITKPITDVTNYYTGKNRANSMGDALESYIKDSFCNSFDQSREEADISYAEVFAYLGNQNNPPDLILKNGDSLEIKKIESSTSALALNSSHPKNKLYSDDSRITRACKDSDGGNWEEKDIIYVVGVAPDSKLKSLWFVYGDCYAADREVYERVSNKISQGVNEIPGVEMVQTNELAKIKRVDPLGITDLRVRGMWHIENPMKVFSDMQTNLNIPPNSDLQVVALMRKEKYISFPEMDRQALENLQDNNFQISDIRIKDPNNPAILIDSILISYAK